MLLPKGYSECLYWVSKIKCDIKSSGFFAVNDYCEPENPEAPINIIFWFIMDDDGGSRVSVVDECLVLILSGLGTSDHL